MSNEVLVKRHPRRVNCLTPEKPKIEVDIPDVAVPEAGEVSADETEGQETPAKTPRSPDHED